MAYDPNPQAKVIDDDETVDDDATEPDMDLESVWSVTQMSSQDSEA